MKEANRIFGGMVRHGMRRIMPYNGDHDRRRDEARNGGDREDPVPAWQDFQQRDGDYRSEPKADEWRGHLLNTDIQSNAARFGRFDRRHDAGRHICALRQTHDRADEDQAPYARRQSRCRHQ